MLSGSLASVLDQIKAAPGLHYVYALSRPDGVRFYIGVGTGRRIGNHKKRAADGRAPVYAEMRRMAAAGEPVTYAIAGWFDDWGAAAAAERRLIAEIGRADLGLGPLLNATNGGQGTAGAMWMTEARVRGVARAAERNRGRALSPEHKAKISAANKGKVISEEARRKSSATQRGRKAHPNQIAALRARKGEKRPPESSTKKRASMAKYQTIYSQQQRDRWADPVYRDRVTANMRASHQRRAEMETTTSAS